VRGRKGEGKGEGKGHSNPPSKKSGYGPVLFSVLTVIPQRIMDSTQPTTRLPQPFSEDPSIMLSPSMLYYV